MTCATPSGELVGAGSHHEPQNCKILSNKSHATLHVVKDVHDHHNIHSRDPNAKVRSQKHYNDSLHRNTKLSVLWCLTPEGPFTKTRS